MQNYWWFSCVTKSCSITSLIQTKIISSMRMLKFSPWKFQVLRANITVAYTSYLFHLLSFLTFSYNYPKQLSEEVGVHLKQTLCFLPFNFFIRPYSIKREFDRKKILDNMKLWTDRQKGKRPLCGILSNIRSKIYSCNLVTADKFGIF